MNYQEPLFSRRPFQQYTKEKMSLCFNSLEGDFKQSVHQMTPENLSSFIQQAIAKYQILELFLNDTADSISQRVDDTGYYFYIPFTGHKELFRLSVIKSDKYPKAIINGNELIVRVDRSIKEVDAVKADLQRQLEDTYIFIKAQHPLITTFNNELSAQITARYQMMFNNYIDNLAMQEKLGFNLKNM